MFSKYSIDYDMLIDADSNLFINRMNFPEVKLFGKKDLYIIILVSNLIEYFWQ